MVSVECAVTYRSNPVARREWNDVPTIPSYRTGAHPGTRRPRVAQARPLGAGAGPALDERTATGRTTPPTCRGTRYSPLDQINALELQQARSRVALQDRQPRPAPRVQARRHAAHGQGRALHDRRHAPVGGRARRQDRRGDLDAQPARRQARRGLAAAAVGPRRVVLDRRQRRRARSSTSRPATGWSS